MEETIPVLLAVHQEVKLRKFFQMILLCCVCLMILITVASFFGILFQVALLSVMFLIYFYVVNKKEVDRLVAKYGE